MKPVAAIVDETEHAPLRLVKIDVEGYEVEVLEGVELLLAGGSRFALVVEVHSNRASQTLTALERFRTTFALRANVVRVPGHDRLGRVPPPHELGVLDEVAERYVDRTVKLALVPTDRSDTVGRS